VAGFLVLLNVLLEASRLEQEVRIRDEEAEQSQRLLALEDEMLAAQLTEIRSEAERDVLNERRDRLEYERNELGEHEARVEREVELRQAEIALRRADIVDRRREVEIVRRERRARMISAQARRDLDRSRAQRGGDRERPRRSYEGLRREYEGRHMEAQAMAQVEVLREILQRPDDDGVASRHLADLERSLEELPERRADEVDRQEGSP
jgi:hypothetical protein